MKVESFDRLEAIGADAWRTLHAESRLRSPFTTLTWQREWVRAFLGAARLEVRTVTDEAGRLVAALSLYEAEPRVWRLVGGVDVSDYLDLVAIAGREEEAWSALLQDRAAGEPVVWDLHAVPAASPTVTAVPALARAVGLDVTTTVEERCPVLDLPATWDAYLERLPSKHRHEMQRKIRRFRREVPDGRVASADDPEQIALRFDDFLELHRRSRTGKARFMDTRMEAFFRSAIRALAAEGAGRVWFLDTPRGPIASFVVVEWEGTVGLYNSGFDPATASLSPGLVLLAHLVEDAIARGKTRFDFLRGEERYKYEFGPVPEDIFIVRLADPHAVQGA